MTNQDTTDVVLLIVMYVAATALVVWVKRWAKRRHTAYTANPPRWQRLTCTPLRERSCPVHGRCTCPPDLYDPTVDDLVMGLSVECPLHGLHSDHPTPTQARSLR